MKQITAAMRCFLIMPLRDRVEISHSECDVQTFLFKMLKKLNFGGLNEEFTSLQN